MSCINIPSQTRSILATHKVDVEARTVEVVFATETPVRRRKYEGWDTIVEFDEILTISRAAVDMTRMEAGAPVLDSHSRYSTQSQVGVVEKAWIDGKDARALVRFPAAGVDPMSDRMFALIEQGIIRNVSVGYTLQKIKVKEAEKRGEVSVVTATRWQPFEVSFVPVPADPNSGVRSEVLDQRNLVEVELGHQAALARMRMRSRSI